MGLAFRIGVGPSFLGVGVGDGLARPTQEQRQGKARPDPKGTKEHVLLNVSCVFVFFVF